MSAGLLFALVGLMASFALALSRAMTNKPDPGELMQKPLNALLVAAMGWSALALTGLTALLRFGLVQPVLGALVLAATYRIFAGQDLIPYYRFALAIGLITLISTILVTSQNLIPGSTS